MKRYLTYFFFYSFGGWVLERIINVIFLGHWYDNGVLFGPYQGLYGVPVVLTIIVYDKLILRSKNKYVIELLFMLTAIIFTYLSEGLTGIGYELLTGSQLWDYGATFVCKYPYICLLPSTIFGFVSYLIIRFLHPLFKRFLDKVNTPFLYILSIIYIIDVIVTFTILL